MAIIDADFWEVRRIMKGVCGASCRGAPYLRRKPVPCNPRTTNQLRTRALWARAFWYWNNVLDPGERWYWNTFRPGRTWYDQMEQWRRLTGCGYFVALASRAMLGGFDPILDLDSLWAGWALESMSIALLTPSRVRVTFATNPGEWHCLAVYGRGPTSVGDSRVVREAEWSRYQVPCGWQWIGYGGADENSPIDFDLPWAIPAGRKLRMIGTKMALCGFLTTDWVTAEVVA